MNEKMNTPLGSAFPKERVRYAMLSFFLAQGLCFSSWASRIPDVKDFFGNIGSFCGHWKSCRIWCISLCKNQTHVSDQ